MHSFLWGLPQLCPCRSDGLHLCVSAPAPSLFRSSYFLLSWWIPVKGLLGDVSMFHTALASWGCSNAFPCSLVQISLPHIEFGCSRSLFWSCFWLSEELSAHWLPEDFSPFYWRGLFRSQVVSWICCCGFCNRSVSFSGAGLLAQRPTPKPGGPVGLVSEFSFS